MQIDLAAIAASAAGSVVGLAPDHGRGRWRGRGPHRGWHRGAGGAPWGAGPGRTRWGSGTVVALGEPAVVAIVTTAHTAGAQGGRVRVRHRDGEAAGVVAGADESLDLAVVVLDDDGPGLQSLTWGNPTGLVIGADVAAAAAPDGVVRATAGQVAAVDGRYRTRTGSPVDGVADHTAPLPPGASGGPVLDEGGRVLGIDVNRLGGGLYQAVLATDQLRTALDALLDGRTARPRRLGVTAVPSRRARWIRDAAGLPAREGVLVAAVADGSAAATAGLRRGDLLTALDGTALHGIDDLQLALRRSGPEVHLDLVTGGVEERAVDVVLDEPAEDPAAA